MLGELIGILVIALVTGFWRTTKMEHSADQVRFTLGTAPSKPLDGFYNGTVVGYWGVWRGKKFNASAMTGINVVQNHGETTEKFPFRTYQAAGARDKNTMVLAIDYNISGNPFWLRPILDEVVEVAPGELLGKMQLRIIPGWPFTILFFSLKKE